MVMNEFLKFILHKLLFLNKISYIFLERCFVSDDYILKITNNFFQVKQTEFLDF